MGLSLKSGLEFGTFKYLLTLDSLHFAPATFTLKSKDRMATFRKSSVLEIPSSAYEFEKSETFRNIKAVKKHLLK